MKFYKYWLPVIVWASVIFLFSNRSSFQASEFYLWDFLLKKSAHLIEYAIFGILIFRALVNYSFERKRAIVVSILFSVLYAIGDEYHQSFIAGRTSTMRDVIIDTIGATVGVNICKEKF